MSWRGAATFGRFVSGREGTLSRESTGRSSMTKAGLWITDFCSILARPNIRLQRWHRSAGANVKPWAVAAENHDMRGHAAHALLVLLVLPMACKFPDKGARVTTEPPRVTVPSPAPGPEVNSVPSNTTEPNVATRPPVVEGQRCGPQPSRKQVERLVRQQHPGAAARDFHYSKLERWRVTRGRKVWGWRVVVDITRKKASRQKETNRYAYLIRKQPQGIAIIATGEGREGRDDFVWSLRQTDQLARKHAGQEALERRRRMWARARAVPTMEELVAADFGPAPTRYRKTIRDHLRKVHDLPKSTRLRLRQPIKTWARRVGSGDTVFGWRVTAAVIGKPDAAGNRIRRHHFMFRRGKLISTTRLSKGFRLVVEGELPEPPPALGPDETLNPPR